MIFMSKYHCYILPNKHLTTIAGGVMCLSTEGRKMLNEKRVKMNSC